MSPKLPINNSQTITEFLNLHKNQISEEDSEDSYKFAFGDEAFLSRRETIGIRFELELLKPEILLKEHGIEHTITVFGSTRFISHAEALTLKENAKTPEKIADANRALLHSKYYESAREFGSLVAHYNATQENNFNKLHICTGGGPGIMEAANRGAFEAGDKTIGFNISLPREQHPNPYVSPGLSFRFHYFALRKMHFMLRARAIVAFPGGFGSCDELFEVLTLIQTKKVVPIPVILVGKEYWNEMINFDHMVEFGVIDQEDMQTIHFSETAQEAWQVIQDWYQLG
ncbi:MULTISPECIES: LOG family protein [unclassified Polynucleobacter]|uniref:LOG family protein n=1 Tax=unclassified Polynucleobacter TaxID=2640945 RepID=UPI001C0E2F8F|nr:MULTISPECIES: LOG family protein [unclassified Polynucleobacter]MBU3549403.1 LOG family protein [Polynucleobacter sp. P1-05-14]MBU3638878.1 LOG family protein [Polynucleobacter sp. AP-RePozz3-80-G7]MBU3640703.1 LOG family protein [Polynucleobacter sp. Fuers-14]